MAQEKKLAQCCSGSSCTLDPHHGPTHSPLISAAAICSCCSQLRSSWPKSRIERGVTELFRMTAAAVWAPAPATAGAMPVMPAATAGPMPQLPEGLAAVPVLQVWALTGLRGAARVGAQAGTDEIGTAIASGSTTAAAAAAAAVMPGASVLQGASGRGCRV